MRSESPSPACSSAWTLGSLASTNTSADGGERLARLEGRFDTLVGKFDTLERKFGTLETKVDSLGSKVDTLDGKVDTLTAACLKP